MELHDNGTKPTPQPAAAANSPRPRRWLRRLGWGLLGLMAVLALAAGGFWYWAAGERSLAAILHTLQRHMPAGSSLQVEGVSGSLRAGGHIDRLVYRKNGQTSAPPEASATTAVSGAAETDGALTVTVENVDVQWSWTLLREPSFWLRRLHARQVTVADTRAATSDAPSAPLTELVLPVDVKAPFAVDVLRIVGQSGHVTQLTNLQGSYRYDLADARHTVQVERLQHDYGNAHLQATVQGRAPMAVQLQGGGQLLWPAQNKMPAQTVRLELQAGGTLSGMEAALQIAGKAYPVQTAVQSANPAASAAAVSVVAADPASMAARAGVSPSNAPAKNAHIQLQGTIHPWRKQPIGQARVALQAVNLQAFWPQVPLTDLSGHLQLQAQAQAKTTPAATQANGRAAAAHNAAATTAAAASSAASTAAPSNAALAQADELLHLLGNDRWQGEVVISNAAAGAWNEGALPVHSLKGELQAADGALRVRNMHWQPSQQGGAVTGDMHYQAQQGWRGEWRLERLDLAAIYSTLQAERLQGTVSVRSNSRADWKEESVQPPSPKATMPARAAQAEAAGVDTAATAAPITFAVALQSVPEKALRLRFDEITLQGRWHAQTLDLPTIRVRSRGGVLQGRAQYAAAQQAVQADMQLRLPGSSAWVKGRLSPTNGQGQVGVDARNLLQTGGWLQQWPLLQNTLRARRLEGHAQLRADWRGGWQNNGQNMQLNALLTAPSVTLRSAPRADTPLLVQNARLSAQGRLSDMRVDAQGQLRQGGYVLHTVLQGQGGKRDTGWKAHVQALQASLQDTAQNRRWQAKLAAPVSVEITQAPQQTSLQTGALHIALDGADGQANIQADPVRWVQKEKGFSLTSKGRIQGLPLAWMTLLTQSEQMLAGDMRLAGQWDVELGHNLRLQAQLARSSGDLVILTGDGASTQAARQGRIAAGVRTARVEVHNTGNQVALQLQWDSAQAGSAQAQVRTQLAQTASGWGLALHAPLQGRVQARLPRVGVWNVFAPPGWRLRGTLDADIAISGTVQAPLLQGTLNADNLGVRSVVDGLAFSNGRLRARLNGHRMDIDEFSLQGTDARTGFLGASRIGGGSARMTGYAQWGGNAQQPLLQSMRVQLAASLQQLQLFSTADRMLVLSGNVTASLADLKMVARGGLQVERALIELPEDSAPVLDDDVVVLPSRKHPKAALLQKNAQAATTSATSPATTTSASATAGPQGAATQPGLDGDVVVQSGGAKAGASRGAVASASQPHTQNAAAQQTAARQSTGRQPAARVAAVPSASAQAAATQQTGAQTDMQSAKAQPNPDLQVDVQINIGLGNNFRVRGYGLDTRLRGRLALVGGPTLQAPPRLTGTVRTVDGTFRAYGQDLQIESGRIVFSGALDNPALDVVAIRGNIDQRVGLRITGTAQRPSVQLFSDTATPDSERLSWLVLGRSSYSATDMALLQQAAMALLSGSGRGVTGQIADALGLDELGFKGGEGLSGSSILLGKRFSKRFYATYEKGLDATLGTLYFFMDINRRLKLRAQTGQESELDLIYTVSYD